MGCINYRGVKLGGKIEDWLTVGKILPLILLVAIGALFFNPSNFTVPQASDWTPVFGAIILALWAYQGAEIITVPEEEIKHAKKTVPRAIIVSVLTVMALYLLVAGAVLALDWKPFAASQAPLADLASATAGPWAGFAMAVGGLLSILGALNAVILGSARISYAMGKDKLFPSYFNHLHEEHGTPDHALVAHFVGAVALSFALQDFSKLATLVVFFTLVPYFFSCVATFVLQKKLVHEHSLLGNNQVVPLVGVVSSLLLAVFAWTLSAWMATALLAGGLAWYALRPKRSPTRNA